jgi:predicted transcriptional regulator
VFLIDRNNFQELSTPVTGGLASGNKCTSLDIVREVLSIASDKVRKTRIMYGANLSFLQLEKYLSTLLGNALLSFDGDSGYLTTASGKEFLKLYADYLERSTRLMGEVESHTKDRQYLENLCGLGKDAQ